MEKKDDKIELFKEYIYKKMWFNMYYNMPKKLIDEMTGNKIGDDDEKQCLERWEYFYNWCKENDLVKQLLLKFLGVFNIKFVKREILKGFTNKKKVQFLTNQIYKYEIILCMS